LVDFFNGHPRLRKFEIHGAMFAALCQRNSLKNVSALPCLLLLYCNIVVPPIICMTCVTVANSCDLPMQLDSRFTIPCLEELLITVRSPLNAEQKLSTLESLVKYSVNLQAMVIRISQMKNCHDAADDFFEEICKFKYTNYRKVRIE
jgi:hypothetical protein